MADLAALDALCVWMRANGATSARVGDVELTLGPVALAPAVYLEQPSPPESSQDAERRDLETLLHSSGASIEPFLRKGHVA